MNVLSIIALFLAIIGSVIPTFGIAFSVVASLFAFFVYRGSPLIGGMVIGISLVSSASMTPELMTMDVVLQSTMDSEAIRNSHGLLYWGVTVFHASLWVLAILFRSGGFSDQYRKALDKEMEMLKD